MVKKAVKRALATSSGARRPIGGRIAAATPIANRILATSRVIQKAARPVARRQMVVQRPKIVRQRIAAPEYVEEIIERPVQVIRRPQVAAVRKQVVIRRAAPLQNIRQRIQQQRQIVREQPRERVIVQRSIPRVQQQVIRRPARIERPQQFRERVEYVQVDRSPRFSGSSRRGGFRGGRQQARIVEVDRFEDYNTGRFSSSRKGRGFRSDY
ncbi:unnamed protein product, partial [Mesorhabditis spiculigera]